MPESVGDGSGSVAEHGLIRYSGMLTNLLAIDAGATSVLSGLKPTTPPRSAGQWTAGPVPAGKPTFQRAHALRPSRRPILRVTDMPHLDELVHLLLQFIVFVPDARRNNEARRERRTSLLPSLHG